MYKANLSQISKKGLQLSSWIIVIFIAAVVFALLTANNHISSNNKEPSKDDLIEKDPSSIAIPGYESIELKANSKQQSVCLHNPIQNSCYFKVSLFLADGTLLWQSELIEPGSNSKPIVLLMPLEKGTYYNATLKYSCFSMNDDLSQLNGAETKVTLQLK